MTNAQTCSVRLLGSDMRVRTVTGFPVLRGALAFARDFVLDDDGSFVAAHVYEGDRLLATVTVFDAIIEEFFAFAAAVAQP